MTFNGALSPTVVSGTRTRGRDSILKTDLRWRREDRRDVLYRCCCGMDVHKDTVAACVLMWEAGAARKEKRIFGTTTQQLLELSDWLHSQEVTHVAMESTGVYFALSSALIGRVQVPPALG